jgi:lysozyme
MPGNVKAKAAAGGALALAIGIIAVFEGTRTTAYIDPVGVPTICTGHTGPEVKVGDTVTREVCNDLLAHDMGWAFSELDQDVPNASALEPWTRAAMASFIYNLGGPAFRTSPIDDLLRLGKVTDACDAMLPYNMGPDYDAKTGKVKRDPKTGKPLKKVYAGLMRRREAERHLCRGEPW